MAMVEQVIFLHKLHVESSTRENLSVTPKKSNFIEKQTENTIHTSWNAMSERYNLLMFYSHLQNDDSLNDILTLCPKKISVDTWHTEFAVI